jgi:Ribose/xylose/arabinose/galactoside ABC-type transport systems, permease components
MEKNFVDKLSGSETRINRLTRGIFGFCREYPAFLFLIVLTIAGSLLSPVFMTAKNILNILWTISVLGIVALGQTMLLISGNFDMSVAYTIGLAGITTVLAQLFGANLIVSVALGLLAGALVGLLNGLVIVLTKANAFLITLGTGILVYSLSLVLTRSKTFYTSIDAFLILGRGKIFGYLYYSVLLLLLLALILQMVLKHTVYGRALFVIGLNQRAGKLAGIKTDTLKILTYVLCGVMAALAGLVMTARTGSTVANAGVGMEFESLIASVLGGTSLFGGKGGTLRTVIGVLVLGVLNNLLILLNVPYEAQQIAKGSVFLFVVFLDGAFQSQRR